MCDSRTGDSRPTRLFLALWPPRGVRRCLAAWATQAQAACGGRVMRADNLHLTLLFLGSVPSTQLPALQQHLDQVMCVPFTFQLSSLQSWRHNRILYAAPASAVPALEALAAGIRQAVAAIGIPFDAQPFSPHVTLLRHIRQTCAPRQMPPVTWQVNAFVLVESVTTPEGVRYRQLRRWPCWTPMQR